MLRARSVASGRVQISVGMLQKVARTEYVRQAQNSVGATLSQNPKNAKKPPSQVALAVRDILGGARLWFVWGTFGWHDIRQRYRRSRIGAFWLTISMGVMVGALGALYAALFKADVSQYLPYVATGIVTWGFVSGLINEGCSAFIEGQASIKQVRLPLSVYVYRVVWRNLVIFGHNFLIIIVVAMIFAILPRWTVLLAVPAIALLCLNGVWVGLLLGMLSARFRDVPQIVASATQILFFLTPIIWQQELLPGRPLVVTFNPFFYAVELVRGPLMGAAPPLLYWLVVLAAACAGSVVALAMYVPYRRRIAYWI